MRDRILRRYARLAHLTRSDNPPEAALAREHMRALERDHPWVRSGQAPSPRKSRAEVQSMLDIIHLLNSDRRQSLSAVIMGLAPTPPTLTDMYVSGMAGGIRPDGVDAAILAVWQATVRQMRARQAGAPDPTAGNALSFWQLARAESDRLAPLPGIDGPSTSRPNHEHNRRALFSLC